MRKVCEVYLVSSAASDERGVELTFPVSQYEMMDAFEQIHTKSPGDVYWQVDEFYCFDYLAPHLDESMSIFEFNSLTEQLSKLDSYQETALEGLLQMQVKNHMQENSGIITVPELMMLAANVNRCHVLADIWHARTPRLSKEKCGTLLLSYENGALKRSILKTIIARLRFGRR